MNKTPKPKQMLPLKESDKRLAKLYLSSSFLSHPSVKVKQDVFTCTTVQYPDFD
jgi:hypothetical protein